MDGWLNLSPEEWTAVRLSVRVATVAMLTSLPIGIAVAYLLARYKFPGKSVVDGIVLLPLILPPVVTGYLLLLTFGRRGLIGSFLAEQFGIVFSFRWTGAALACGVMGFPLMVRAIRLSIEAVDRRLEESCRHAWRQSVLGVRIRHVPADCARNHRRHDLMLCQSHG